MAKKKTMPLNEAIQEVLATRGQPAERPARAHLPAGARGGDNRPPGSRALREDGRAERIPQRLQAPHSHHRCGDLNLLVPQDRDGTFSTSLFERYQRSDKALVLALMEMYVKGVSTRKVAAITEKLCGKSFSSQLVSNSCGHGPRCRALEDEAA